MWFLSVLIHENQTSKSKTWGQPHKENHQRRVRRRNRNKETTLEHWHWGQTFCSVKRAEGSKTSRGCMTKLNRTQEAFYNTTITTIKSKWLKSSQNSCTGTSKNRILFFFPFLFLYLFLYPNCLTLKFDFYFDLKIAESVTNTPRLSFKSNSSAKWFLFQAGNNRNPFSAALYQDLVWWIMQL